VESYLDKVLYHALETKLRLTVDLPEPSRTRLGLFFRQSMYRVLRRDRRRGSKGLREDIGRFLDAHPEHEETAK